MLSPFLVTSTGWSRQAIIPMTIEDVAGPGFRSDGTLGAFRPRVIRIRVRRLYAQGSDDSVLRLFIASMVHFLSLWMLDSIIPSLYARRTAHSGFQLMD